MKLTQRQVVSLVLLAMAALGFWHVYNYSPAGASWYPPCFFHALTGLQCPGCGATRALHALLHGRFAEAVHQNLLLVLAFPFLVYAISRAWWRWAFAVPPSPAPVSHRWAIRFTLLVGPLVILFGILRNLPWHPFDLLAPY